MPARARGKLLNECAVLLQQQAEEIAQLLALETGKAIRTESRPEAMVVADCFTFYGGLAGALKGETIPFSPTMMTLTQREPLGFVGALLPSTAPLIPMDFKLAPALAAGRAGDR